jgi:mannose-6-phosphate isomerase-like protein (cupin superfamily)
MSKTNSDYNIDLEVKYGHQELIDVSKMARETTTKWSNRSLTKVNGSVVRLGVIEGEFHWHKHDNDDEFFYVTEGQLLIDLEGRTVTLDPGQGMTVAKGVMHRTRAPKRTVILMVETADIQPVGD